MSELESRRSGFNPAQSAEVYPMCMWPNEVNGLAYTSGWLTHNRPTALGRRPQTDRQPHSPNPANSKRLHFGCPGGRSGRQTKSTGFTLFAFARSAAGDNLPTCSSTHSRNSCPPAGPVECNLAAFVRGFVRANCRGLLEYLASTHVAASTDVGQVDWSGLGVDLICPTLGLDLIRQLQHAMQLSRPPVMARLFLRKDEIDPRRVMRSPDGPELTDPQCECPRYVLHRNVAPKISP